MDLIGRDRFGAHVSNQTRFVLIAAGASLVIFAPVSYSHAFVRARDLLTDFHLHRLWAMSLQQQGADSIPPYVLAHSAWQWLLVLLNSVLGISFNFAGFLGAIFSWASAVAVIAYWFYPTLSDRNLSLGLRLLVIFGTSIAAPVALLWPADGLLYMGYIGMASYHNPTIILLKPFAILQLIYAIRCLSAATSLSKAQVAAGALVSLLAAFVKPSLAICLLPALVIIGGVRWVQKKTVDRRGALVGVVLPTILVLTWQFLLSYYTNDTSAIGFYPFEVMRAHSEFLGIKFLLSVLFPLSLSILFFREVARDVRMVLAWLVFIFGTTFTYLFAEAGARMLDGNFTWSGEISLLLLFVAATLFFLENRSGTAAARGILSAFWVLHLLFGVLYYSIAAFHGSYL